MFLVNFVSMFLVLSLANVTHLWEQLAIVGIILFSNVIAFNDGKSKSQKSEVA